MGKYDLKNLIIPNNWSITALGKLGSFSKGKGITKEQLVNMGLPCIRYGEIYTTHEFIIKEFKSFINDEVALDSMKIKKGDLLFAGSGETAEEIGKAVAFISDEQAYAGGDIIILSTYKDKIDVECLSYALETDIAKMQKRVLGQGNSVVHIYSNDLAKIKIPLPPLPEQKAIATCLSTWDEAITKTNQLIAQKELRKKWLMQQLLTGKKRLKGFGGEWQERKLGELGGFSKGAGITKDEIISEGLPAIRYGELYTSHHFIINEINTFIDGDSANASKQIIKGDILFAGSGETKEEIGKCAAFVHEYTAYAGGDIIIFSPISCDSYYLGYALSNEYINAQKSAMGKGHSVVHIYPKDLSAITLKLPLIKEQTAIANVLQAADKEIELLKIKRDHLKQQKERLDATVVDGEKEIENKD